MLKVFILRGDELEITYQLITQITLMMLKTVFRKTCHLMLFRQQVYTAEEACAVSMNAETAALLSPHNERRD